MSRTLKSDNRVFAARETRLRKADAFAIVTEPFEVDWYDQSQIKGWGVNELAAAKVGAETHDSSKGVFIGIAKETDVNAYLDGARYYELKEWSSDPSNDREVEYQLHSGDLMPSDPTAKTFWEASAYGTGWRTLDWKPEIGRWVLVSTNKDGSAGIDVSGSLGAELPWLFWLGVALIPLGVVVLTGGTVMVYFAATRPK